MEKLKTTRFNMRNRIFIAAGFLILALVATMIGLFAFRITAPEAQKVRDELQQEFDRINDPRFIFGNNLTLTLIMFIPLIGIFWGCFILFNTGSIIAILSVAEGMPPILTFLVLILNPVVWLEFAVYAAAMSQSFVWLLQIFRKRSVKEAARTCIVITICAFTLLLAAVVEWMLINSIGG